MSYKTKGKILEKEITLKHTTGLAWIYNPLHYLGEEKTFTIRGLPLLKEGTKLKFTLEIVE